MIDADYSSEWTLMDELLIDDILFSFQPVAREESKQMVYVDKPAHSALYEDSEAFHLSLEQRFRQLRNEPFFPSENFELVSLPFAASLAEVTEGDIRRAVRRGELRRRILKNGICILVSDLENWVSRNNP